MKIVYWAPHVGHVGTIRAIVNSAIAMRRCGRHQVHLVRNHSEWEGCEDLLRAEGIGIVDFGLKGAFPRLNQNRWIGGRGYMLTAAILGFFQLRRLLRRCEPDMLITGLIAVPAVLAALTIRHRPRIVVSIQGFPKFLGDKGVAISSTRWMKVEDAIRRRLWKHVYRRADLLVCLSAATRDRLLANLPLDPARVVVVKNPVVDERIRALESQVLNDSWFCEPGWRRVVAVGRLTRQKDFKTLIEGVARLPRYLRIRVALLGEGEERASLERAINRHGLADSVRLYGFIGNPYVYMKAAEVFVSTSLWEDPGHAVLEAAALGTPIVATSCAGVVDAIGAGAEWCPVGDAGALAERIAKVLERGPDAAKLAVARAQASQFSLPGHYAAMAAHLQMPMSAAP